MTIDASIGLAFSIHSSPGVFAVLVGSGISRAAGIPTGWDVVLDLVRKLAAVRAEDAGPDPVAWYRACFGSEPHYSQLLEQVARTPAERRNLLRGYFEPNDEEREQGLKVPTAAHRAIAELVSKGFLRIILTTNFDRLMETALDDVGVIPNVIASASAVEGALPLAHSPCTVIKINGDYLDTRLRNTEGELVAYEPELDRLLDQVFDEYGLIICGWSADWDAGLATALERCRSRRFSTYWTTRGTSGDVAQRLQVHRQATTITIADANVFLSDIRDKVLALHDLNRPHPLSVQAVIATVKRYLPEERERIRLQDLVIDETETVWKRGNDKAFPQPGENPTPESIRKRAEQYDAFLERLEAVIAVGGFYGRQDHIELWSRSIERVAMIYGRRSGFLAYSSLNAYPALRLVYAGGIASLAASQYGTLAALLTIPYGRRDEDKTQPLIASEVYRDRNCEQRGLHFSLSKRLYSTLRSTLSPYIPANREYRRYFKRFEIIASAASAHLSASDRNWVPVCHFHFVGGADGELERIDDEVSRVGQNWGPLKAGMFSSDLVTLRESLDVVRHLRATLYDETWLD